MADKEEVEPTEESATTESSDAATDPAAGRAADDGYQVASGPVEDQDGNDLGSDRDGDEERVLEPVGVAAAGSSTVAARKAGREAKGTATRKRDQPVKQERTGPVKFVRESVGELRKVVYPTGQQLINYFIVVLVFVLFVIGYVSLLDLGMGWAIFKVFS